MSGHPEDPGGIGPLADRPPPPMTTIDHPASPGDVTRAALWCVYLIGELLVLGSLWFAGSQDYDVGGSPRRSMHGSARSIERSCS